MCGVKNKTPVFVFHATQEPANEYLSQGHNEVMSSMVIEPATLRSPTRHSSQLSDVAALMVYCVTNATHTLTAKPCNNFKKRIC